MGARAQSGDDGILGVVVYRVKANRLHHRAFSKCPPTSAHGELVEPSMTVLRQAQDERMVNFHNFEKALDFINFLTIR